MTLAPAGSKWHNSHGLPVPADTTGGLDARCSDLIDICRGNHPTSVQGGEKTRWLTRGRVRSWQELGVTLRGGNPDADVSLVISGRVVSPLTPLLGPNLGSEQSGRDPATAI